MASAASASPSVRFSFTSSSASSSSARDGSTIFFFAYAQTERRRKHHQQQQLLRLPSPRSSFITSARRRRNLSMSTTKSSPVLPKPKQKQDDDVDEDAFEALFAQLEEDLKNDDLSANDTDDEVTEADLAMLEKELAEALGDLDDDFSDTLVSLPDDTDSEDVEPEERHPKLKKLANAQIKSLAAELGLDRAFVLQLLRDPPYSILMLSASMPATITQQPTDVPSEPVEQHDSTPLPAKIDSEAKPPVHVMQTRWSAQKRLKKVQVEVLERVYWRTKHPTKAMISSIIQVTNLPWKRVVKWFEDKRDKDGIPKKRVPFHRQPDESL